MQFFERSTEKCSFCNKVLHDDSKSRSKHFLKRHLKLYKAPLKGATKSYFTHYSCVIIILFNTGLCRSIFSTISFGKLVFRFSVLSAVFFVLNQML